MSDTAQTIEREIIADLKADGASAPFFVLRPGEPIGEGRDRRPGPSVAHEGICIPDSANYSQLTGTVIEEGERVFLVFGLPVVPNTTDKAKIYGGDEVWQIKDVSPQDYAGGAYGYRVKIGR